MPLRPAHTEKTAHDLPPVERLTGRVERDRHQPPGGVLRRNVDAMGDVVQRLQQRARFQIEAGDAFGRVGGRERIECLLRDVILGASRPEAEDAHELLHFHAPNHGKLWKSLMRSHLGQYEQLEAELRRIAYDKAMELTRR